MFLRNTHAAPGTSALLASANKSAPIHNPISLLFTLFGVRAQQQMSVVELRHLLSRQREVTDLSDWYLLSFFSSIIFPTCFKHLNITLKEIHLLPPSLSFVLFPLPLFVTPPPSISLSLFKRADRWILVNATDATRARRVICYITYYIYRKKINSWYTRHDN